MTNIIHVSTSYRCDRETRELGEDYHRLVTVEKAYRALEAALEFVRPVMASKDGGAAVQGMLEGLANIRHDSCFGSTLELAKDAASEARVVQMRRPRP